MKYPSYLGMTDEELIAYIDKWWRTASIEELIRRYKLATDQLKEYRSRGY